MVFEIFACSCKLDYGVRKNMQLISDNLLCLVYITTLIPLWFRQLTLLYDFTFQSKLQDSIAESEVVIEIEKRGQAGCMGVRHRLRPE